MALWYASAAVLSLTCLFVAGYYLLQINLVNGLDYLNRAEFQEIKAHLGDDFAFLKAAEIEQRIRETTEYAAVMFYVSIAQPAGAEREIFSSRNLRGMEIPDTKGKRVFDGDVPEIGRLRVGEFILGPFDVTVATSRRSVDDALSDYVKICASLLVVLAVASWGIGLGLSRIALRPIRSIRETAIRISSENLSERIPIGSARDEISDLALLLNQTFSRLETSFQQIRRFTADASHELKTPLSLIRLQAERLLMQGNLNVEDAESVHVQLEELASLSQTIEELLFLSRAEAQGVHLDMAPHPPSAVLESFNQDARALAEHRGARFEFSHTGEGTVAMEVNSIRRVLLNLLTNSLKASPAGATITLDSSIVGERWQVRLYDQGHGVPAQFLESIFERFLRLAPENFDGSSGSGLGLAICRTIIMLHNGTIWAEPSPHSTGLCVVFSLPVASSA